MEKRGEKSFEKMRRLKMAILCNMGSKERIKAPAAHRVTSEEDESITGQ